MIRDVTVYAYDASDPITMTTNPAGLTPDAHGVKWALEDIDGWNNGPDVKAPVFDFPGQDGGIAGAFNYKPRLLELVGGLLAPSQQLAEEACQRLLGAFELRNNAYQDTPRPAWINDYDTTGSGYFALWKRNGVIELKPAMYGRAARFSVPLVMEDPRKYSFLTPSVTALGPSSPVVSATVLGNMPTFPVLVRVTGPVSNPRVTHTRTGRFFEFTGSISAGQYADINMQSHVVTGAKTRNDMIGASQFFPLLPGTDGATLTGGGMTGATALRIDWKHAYQ